MEIDEVMSKTKLVKKGGSCFECCDYEDIVKDIKKVLIRETRDAWDNGYQCGHFRTDIGTSKMDYFNKGK
jgi:hypothetical protein